MSDKSQLVELIKRYAQVPTRSKGDHTVPAPAPAPAKPGSSAISGGRGVPGRGGPRPSGGGGSASQGHFINDVIKMQDQLINLANTVVKESGPFNITPQQEKQTGAPGDQMAPMSRTSYLDFITQYYAQRSDVAGVEFNPDPRAAKMTEKNPYRATRMNTLMDTMRRIGGEKNELKTDGVWGPRTNAAVKNAYALAFALLKMALDFRYSSKAYNEANLTQFKELIPDDPYQLSNPDKERNAKEIVRHLKGIRNMFQEVKSRVLENPRYQSYIEGAEPFATYKKEATPILTTQQIQSSMQSFPNGFTIPLDGGNMFTFYPRDLASKDTFLSVVEKASSVAKVKLDPYSILGQISQKIGEVIK